MPICYHLGQPPARWWPYNSAEFQQINPAKRQQIVT